MTGRRIYYWNGIIARDPAFLDAIVKEYTEILCRLLEGDYKSLDLDLKHIPDYRLYTIRLNQSDRLLFTTHTMPDGTRSLLLLDLIWAHDYQKSPFLRPGVVKQFFKKQAHHLNHSISLEWKNLAQESTNEDLDFVDSELDDKSENSLEIQPLSYFNNRFIQLNDEQQGSLETKLPLIISGAPGSGKSSMAFSFFEQTIERSEENLTILYITQSKRLVDQMQSLWQNQPQIPSLVEKHYQVKFMTLEGLFKKEKQLINYERFEAWFKEYEKWQFNIAKARAKGKGKEKAKERMPQEIYEEFRHIAHGKSLEEYISYGKHETSFNESADKEFIYRAYKAYLSYLEETNTIDLSVTTLKSNEVFDFIFVDESQDLSTAELEALFRQARDKAIVYCIDSNQSLQDNRSKMSFLMKMTPNLVTLPGSYRCSTEVTKFANRLLSIKYAVSGGASDKYGHHVITQSHSQIKGNVAWFNLREKKYLDFAEQISKKNSISLAIITLEQYKEEVNNLFNTPLIFTPEEIKGLEYAHIIVYRLFDINAFEQINKKINGMERFEESINKTGSINRAKPGQASHEFDKAFNHIFTAYTRAIETLTLIEEEAHQNRKLVNALKQALPQENMPASLEELPQATKNDWEQERDRLHAEGKAEQANNIAQKLTPTVHEEISSQEPSKSQSKKKKKKKESSLPAFKSTDASTKKVSLTPNAESKPVVVQKMEQNNNVRRLEVIANILNSPQANGENISSVLNALLMNKDIVNVLFSEFNINSVKTDLMSEILSNSAVKMIFLSVFFTKESEDVLINLPSDFLFKKSIKKGSLFYNLVSDTYGLDTINLLLISHKRWCYEVTWENLDERHKCGGDMSAVYFLSKTKLGREMFFMFLLLNPKNYLELPWESFITIPLDIQDKRKRTSPICLLIDHIYYSQDEDQCRVFWGFILNKIKENNQIFEKAIKREGRDTSLMYELPFFRKDRVIFSPHINVSQYFVGFLFDSNKVNMNYNLSFLTEKNSQGISLFLSLSMMPDTSFFERIISAITAKISFNEKIVQQIYDELFKRIHGLQTFALLAASSGGANILCMLLNASKDLVKKISYKDIATPMATKEGKAFTKTHLQLLSSHENGRKALLKILEKNTALLPNIKASDIYDDYKVATSDEKSSMFKNLQNCDEVANAILKELEYSQSSILFHYRQSVEPRTADNEDQVSQSVKLKGTQ